MDPSRSLPLLGLLVGLLLGVPSDSKAGEDELDQLARWMTGSFSSAAQAEVDEDFYEIHLEMARIWDAREDGYWFYVEQAAAGALERPYRQRVYHLHPDEDGGIASVVYALPEPLRFAGAWKEGAPLSSLTPDSLTLREGCTVTLKRHGEGHFEGSTRGSDCTSTLRGASYAVSEVRVDDHGITSWDRGYDSEHQQVWGAEKGPYIFIRKSTPPADQ